MLAGLILIRLSISSPSLVPILRAYVLSNVNRPYDRRLAYAEAGNESARVDGAEIAVGRQEDGDANYPQNAELAGRPYASDPIAKQESTVTD
jgi:hypothetical protein